LSIAIIAGPTITTTSLPNGEVGVAYSQTLAATGGTPPYSNWTVTSGSLPPGLTLTAATGVISGTPTTATGSPFSFSVTVGDSAGATSPPQALSIVITQNGSTFTTIYTFTGGADGGTPFGTPILSAGSLVGTTYAGGTQAAGTVYSVNTANGDEIVLHSFLGLPADGAAPIAGVVLGSGGNLYGATYEGGALNYGTVFELTLAGTETLLHSFAGSPSEGSEPAGTAIFDTSGDLYGTTYQGGANGSGTVYEISAAGVFSTNMSFPTDAGAPRAGLSLVSGQFYGTAAGSSSQSLGGTVYVEGGSTPLYTFTGGADGAQPMGGVVGDGAGNLYGTTAGGGSGSFGNGNGVIFKLNIATVVETVLHTFTGSDGAVPAAGLTRDALGNWYGTTVLGGASNHGTVFELETSGNLTTVYSFTGGADGAYPYAGVIVEANGNIYGATSAGGSAAAPGGYGTLFVITPAAPEKKGATK
jgi:uncharacterized repeat protein (TIGR03803 family)